MALATLQNFKAFSRHRKLVEIVKALRNVSAITASVSAGAAGGIGEADTVTSKQIPGMSDDEILDRIYVSVRDQANESDARPEPEAR